MAARPRNLKRFDLRHFQIPQPPAWAGIWPTAVNHMEVKGRREPWSVPFYCIHLVRSAGLRFYSRGGADVVLADGDTFLIEPEVPFCYHEAGSGFIRLYALRLAGPLAADYVRALGFGPDRLHFRTTDPKGTERIFRELLKLASRSDPAALHLAVAALHRFAPVFGGPADNFEEPADLPDRVLRHLRENLELGENVEQLAARFGVSRSTLFLHFRLRFDRSPAEILIESRLARAKLLLESTALNVIEIARLSGYQSVEHFHRQFREHVEVTPLEWRQNSQTRRT